MARTKSVKQKDNGATVGFEPQLTENTKLEKEIRKNLKGLGHGL